jgi:2-dehydro-3-deoxyphosphogluconate aldolase/(4S)-4-hydroxy-2-oxoglutarate aldolase
VTIDEIMRKAPVIPVLVWDHDLDPTVVAEALVEAGLPVIEMTLRTPGAIAALTAMAKVPGAIAGAGTVTNAQLLAQAADAGAQFIVSPGLTEKMAEAVTETGIPFLPGVATAGEIMRGMELGLNRFKFFPAEAAGGVPVLKAMQGPYPDIRFCPTGGVTTEKARDYLALDCVLCVGGSWIMRPDDTNVSAIAARAKEAAALAGSLQSSS